MRSLTMITLAGLTAALGCIPVAPAQSAGAMSTDPQTDAPEAPPETLEDFLATIADSDRRLDQLDEDEVRELLSFFPDPPPGAEGTNLEAYLAEQGFEPVVLLEPFGYKRHEWSQDDFQLAYASKDRVFLLEPPLIQGLLPAGDYWAHIMSLFFEVIGPDGKIWRFTIRADAD